MTTDMLLLQGMTPDNLVMVAGVVDSWPVRANDQISFVVRCPAEAEASPIAVSVLADRGTQPRGGLAQGDEVRIVGHLVREADPRTVKTVIWRLLEQVPGLEEPLIRTALLSLPQGLINQPAQHPVIQLWADQVKVLRSAPRRDSQRSRPDRPRAARPAQRPATAVPTTVKKGASAAAAPAPAAVDAPAVAAPTTVKAKKAPAATAPTMAKAKKAPAAAVPAAASDVAEVVASA
ncbi:MAG: hypothetical protein KKA73_29270 [Chloroflexi bacterium]|nr:hypothetical protein [Chloroflexota bacterium]MBU1751787.1 hypothetical protein [Chloroflexota bacterium]